MSGGRATVVRLITLTSVYLAGAWAALSMIDDPGEVALFWPASGLALAVLVRFGTHWWLWVAAANLAMHATLDPVSPEFLPFSALSNALGALSAAWWIRHRTPEPRPDIATGLALLQGGIMMGLVSGLIGALGLWLAGLVPGQQWPVAFLRWSMGDFLSVAALTPAALWLLTQPPRIRNSAHFEPGSFAPRSERLVWALLFVAALAGPVFGARFAEAFVLAMASVPLALLLWSAMRFPAAWTLLGSAVAILSLTIATGLGLNGLPQPQHPLEVGLLLGFLSLIGIAPMLVMAGAYQRRLSETQLLRRALTDPLTGLANRTAFEEDLRAEPQPGRPAGRIALLYIDLDHFTLINDTASHAAGDAVIRSIASLIQTELHPGESLYRLGGDEFAAMLIERESGDWRDRGERLLKAIEDFRLPWNDHILSIDASIGLAVFESDQPEQRAQALAQADAACFTAKEMGGARVCVATPGLGDTHLRTQAMHWAIRIREALEHHRFRLYCQDIARLELEPSGRDPLRHFEVLVRLDAGDGGPPTLPTSMIPAAERFGLGVRLDREVVALTLDWLDRDPSLLATVGTCAINLTADSLMDESFADFVARRLDRARVRPQQLCFEITETSAVHDLARAQRFIARMRHLGCRFALDDFGTGFSSFGYLRALAVDFIKIDGSFVREMERSELAAAIIRGITEIARVLGVSTVAEHTASIDLCTLLRRTGVDFAQGYALHRPEPIENYFALPPPILHRRTEMPLGRLGLL